MEIQSCLVKGHVGTILMHFPWIFLLMKCNLHRYQCHIHRGSGSPSVQVKLLELRAISASSTGSNSVFPFLTYWVWPVL